MKHNPKIIKYIKTIAKLHGCRLYLTKGCAKGGMFWGGMIIIGLDCSTKELISIFCHELGHYKNWIEGVHKVYHTMDFNIAIKKMGLSKYVRLALEAEVYTEKMGKEICKIWFPGVKFMAMYQYNSYWLGYFAGKYGSR